MAKVDLDRKTLPAFIRRVNTLAVDLPRRWGPEDAGRAVVHVISIFRMSLGLEQIKDRTLPIVRQLMYLTTFCWMTNWPEGKITGPNLPPVPAEKFTAGKAELVGLMTRFVDELERSPKRKAVHPFVGAISLKKWSRVHGMHTDSHLRQFGV